MFSLTVYSGLFSTCVRPPTTTRFSNFGTSPDPHTQVFCGGGIHLYRGPLQPRRSRESFIAQERVLLHTICEPVVTHRLRMKLTRPTNIFTSKGITGIAHIVCTIVERQCCAKRYYACTLQCCTKADMVEQICYWVIGWFDQLGGCVLSSDVERLLGCDGVPGGSFWRTQGLPLSSRAESQR